jgi:predicted Zn-dependent protease
VVVFWSIDKRNLQIVMQKILFQFFVMLTLFFGLWLGLSQINYVDRADIEKFSKENEKRLGELILKTIQATDIEIDSARVKAIIDSIGRRLCDNSDIDFSKLKIHVIKSNEINAFALPDHNMVIYTGLIDYAKNAEEVAGVMAHEIGHMEKNHVMKKLAKEIGTAMLWTIAGGDAGFEIMKETARVLSSTAFDRTQESEADLFAVEVMAKANVDPEHLANFLFRLGQQHDMPEELEWISTHPNSRERSADIISKKKEFQFEKQPILNTSWDEVKEIFDNATREE